MISLKRAAAPKPDAIKQRVKRLKMSKVVEVEGTKLGEESPSFKYIIMNLPFNKINAEKLAEMDGKIRQVKAFIKSRKAEEKDIPNLVALYNVSFFQCPDPYRPVTEEDMRAILEKSVILIGSMYGVDAVFIVVKMENIPNEAGKYERVGVICGIAVHPRFRQKGVATAIGLEAYKYLLDKNIDYLQCEVYETNGPSMAFITWLGFRPVGELIVKAPSVAQVNPLEHV